VIAAFVVYGNAKSWWDLVVLHSTAAGSLFGVGAGIALVLAILAIAVRVRVDPASLGLAGGSLDASLRLGAHIGGTVALAGGLAILVGSVAARAFGLQLADVAPAASVLWSDLLWRAVLLLWVDTVLPEELAFRGSLLLVLVGQRANEPRLPPPTYRGAWQAIARAACLPAVVVSSLAFAAWHVVVVVQEGAGDPLSALAKLVTIAIGGLLFGALRIVGGNLLAPIIAHWLFDLVAMLAARLAAAV